MGDREQLIAISEGLADAIGRRDAATVRGLLAPAFNHRHAGGDPVEIDGFLDGIANIPGDIVSVRVRQLTVDVDGDSAMVTGIQHAQLKIDGELLDDQRSFVDWFVRIAGAWRLRAAVDLE